MIARRLDVVRSSATALMLLISIIVGTCGVRAQSQDADVSNTTEPLVRQQYTCGTTSPVFVTKGYQVQSIFAQFKT